MNARSVLAATAAVVLVVVGCDRKADAEKKGEGGQKAGSATVVVIGKKGVEKTYLVSDAKKVAALEAFFPDYQSKPKSDVAAGWKAGYFVYFDLPGGESVKLVVSPTDFAKPQWTVGGKGDHAVKGDFGKFVAELDE
jgi:hypothetical protein